MISIFGVWRSTRANHYWLTTIIEPLYEKKFMLHVEPGADQGFFEALDLKKKIAKTLSTILG